MEKVYVCDVGSIQKGHFAWCSHDDECSGKDPAILTKLIREKSDDIKSDCKVSLGFECPLFVPIPKDSEDLGRAREGEGNRSFSASAGAGSLVTGLVQSCWILRELRSQSSVELWPTLCFNEFDSGKANFVLWEAFVSGKGKRRSDSEEDTHLEDAKAALAVYQRRRDRLQEMKDVSAGECFSLVGAALFWSSLVSDRAVLHQPCSVIKV